MLIIPKPAFITRGKGVDEGEGGGRDFKKKCIEKIRLFSIVFYYASLDHIGLLFLILSSLFNLNNHQQHNNSVTHDRDNHHHHPSLPPLYNHHHHLHDIHTDTLKHLKTTHVPKIETIKIK